MVSGHIQVGRKSKEQCQDKDGNGNADDRQSQSMFVPIRFHHVCRQELVWDGFSLGRSIPAASIPSFNSSSQKPKAFLKTIRVIQWEQMHSAA